MIFPPIAWIVPGYIAEGCTILAGAPKIGKSWLVLEWAKAVADGGQCMGAIVQGLGGAFIEHFVYDKQGQLLTGSFADYLLPTASDFPRIRVIALEEKPSPNNPLGAKGAGRASDCRLGRRVGNRCRGGRSQEEP